MTSRTGATSTAGVFQMNVEISRNIQERSAFTVVAIRQLAGFELYTFIFRHERHFRHTSLYDSKPLPQLSAASATHSCILRASAPGNRSKVDRGSGKRPFGKVQPEGERSP